MNKTIKDKVNTDVVGWIDVVIMPGCYPEHNTDGESCWCDPDIETVDGTKIITHREVH